MLTLRVLHCLLPLALAIQSFAVHAEKGTFRLPLKKTSTSTGKHNHLGLQPRGPVRPHSKPPDGYFAKIIVGNQPMQALMDTGSPLLVVPREHYDPSKSTTKKDLNDRLTLFYGDDSGGTTHFFADDVTLPGFGTIKQVTVGRMMESAKKSHLPFAVLGLGHWDASQFNSSELNLIDSMTKQKLLSRAEYTLDLHRGGKGELIFNDPDIKSFTYHKVQQKHGFDLIEASISGTQQLAFFDSGNSLIVLDKKSFKKFAKAHGLKTYWDPVEEAFFATGDCAVDPNVSFTFGQQKIHIPPEVLWAHRKGSSGRCVTVIAGADLITGFWVFGDSFFHAAKVNFGNGKLGFAQKK